MLYYKKRVVGRGNRQISGKVAETDGGSDRGCIPGKSNTSHGLTAYFWQGLYHFCPVPMKQEIICRRRKGRTGI